MSNSLQAYWEAYEKSYDINWKPELEGWNFLTTGTSENRLGLSQSNGWKELVESVVEVLLVILIIILLAIIYYWYKRSRQVRDQFPHMLSIESNTSN